MSDQTPDDAAQAAEWLYPALSNDNEELTYPRSALRQGKRDAYLRGRADERARIAARRDEVARALDPKGWELSEDPRYLHLPAEARESLLRASKSQAAAVLAALGVSDTHRCDNCEGVDPASCLTRSDR